MTSRYHGSKISGSEQSFCTQTSLPRRRFWGEFVFHPSQKGERDERRAPLKPPAWEAIHRQATVWATVLFLSAIIHKQESLTSCKIFSFFFFPAIFTGPRLVEIRILLP